MSHQVNFTYCQALTAHPNDLSLISENHMDKEQYILNIHNLVEIPTIERQEYAP